MFIRSCYTYKNLRIYNIQNAFANITSIINLFRYVRFGINRNIKHDKEPLPVHPRIYHPQKG